VRLGIPLHRNVGGGCAVSTTRPPEIQDIAAYLRLLVNPADSVSLLAGAECAAAGIGKTTLRASPTPPPSWVCRFWRWSAIPEAVCVPWQGRSAKGLLQFSELNRDLGSRIQDAPPRSWLQRVMEQSGYLAELITRATDEAEERRRNLQEWSMPAIQYRKKTREGSLEGFLASAALASDAGQQGHRGQPASP